MQNEFPFKTLAICVAANHIGRGLPEGTGRPAPIVATVGCYRIWTRTAADTLRMNPCASVAIRSPLSLHYRLECLTHLGRIARHPDAAGLHHRQFLLRRALAAGDDGAGVAHALARGCGDAGDEADHGLSHVVFHPQRCGLFIRAADLAHHDHGVGFGIVVEQFQHVDVLHAVHRVAADTDAGGLTHAEFHQLADRLIGQRARARDDADAPFLVDVAGHDAHLDLLRGDDARAVRSDQNRPLVLLAHAVLNLDHVAHRYAFGDADHERSEERRV